LTALGDAESGWELPQGFREPIARLDELARMLLRRGEYCDAIAIQQQRLELILDRQRREGRRLHKGSPFYMIGICLVAKEQQHEAISYLAKALIEDLLSEENSNEVRSFGAYSLLARGYGINEKILGLLSSLTASKKSETQYEPATIYEQWENQRIQTEHLVKEYLSSIGQVPKFAFRKYSMDGKPATREKRVFVGGAFGNHYLLGMMETIILELDFQPILADHFVPRPDVSDRDHSFELLEACSHAVFEISVPDGWGSEVEHARQLGINYLTFYQGEKPSRHVSRMYVDSDHSKGWKTRDDLKEKIGVFLTGR